MASLAACNGASTRDTHATGSGSARPRPQTAQEAMQIVCAGSGSSVPIERISQPDVHRALEELSLDTWPSARTRIGQLATQYGVSPCAIVEAGRAAEPGDASAVTPAGEPAGEIELPQLAGPAEPHRDPPLVTVSKTAVTIAGAHVAGLTGGEISPGQLVHGMIGALVNEVKARAPAGRISIAFDRSIPMTTAHAIFASLAAAGSLQLGLLCEQNEETVLAPMDYVLRPAKGSLVVALDRDKLRVRRTGDSKPIAEAPLDGGVGDILRTLIGARGGGAPAIGLAADDTQTVGKVVEIAGAVRPVASAIYMTP